METLRVQRLRELLATTYGGSQTELAKRVGMSASQLGQYFCGYRNIGEKVARKIEKAAGKPQGWLDGEEDAPVNLSNRDLEILAAWNEASPEAQEVALFVLSSEQTPDPQWLRDDLKQAIDSMLYAAMRWLRSNKKA